MREGKGTYFYASGNRYEGNGKIMTEKAMESFIGKMAAAMKANGKMTKKKVMERFTGKMATSGLVNGKRILCNSRIY